MNDASRNVTRSREMDKQLNEIEQVSLKSLLIM